MARRANIKVVAIEPEFKPGKYKPYTPVKVVTCQEYENENKTHRLSLNMKNPRRVEEWNKVLEKGGCYSVVIATGETIDKKGKKTIKEYVDFEGVFKKLPTNIEVKNQQQELLTKDNAAKLSLENQLNKISKITFETRKYIDGVDEAVAVIREDFNIKG